MNKILKGLGAIALAGVLSLQASNVFADSCDSGEKEKTAYFMFLEKNNIKYFESLTGDATKVTINGALKANRTKGKILQTGTINIKYKDAATSSARATEGTIVGSDSFLGSMTFNCSSETDPNCVEWDVADYWYNYYIGSKNLNKQLEYEGDEAYFIFHSGWYTLESLEQDLLEAGEKKTAKNSDLMDYLDNLIGGKTEEEAKEAIRNDAIYLQGTNLALTEIRRPVDLGTDVMADQLFWKISRKFDKTSVRDTGIINGTVYTPGAYMVKYCDAGWKVLVFEPNADTDTVTGMPGEGDDNKISYKGDSVKIPYDEVNPVREGYVFKEWNTQADGKGKSYAKGSDYDGDEGVLYAIWEPAQKGPFKITYDANGGKDAPEGQASDGSTCITVTDKQPTRKSGQFLGWSTDKDAVTPDDKFKAGEEYCGANGDITLYAVWSDKLGLSAHVVAFGGAILVAIVALVIAKKKDLFKQI